MRSIDRLIARNRRGFAVLGTMVVLGAGALNVHAVLPEHHEGHGSATVCFAAMSIAVLAAFAWRPRRLPRPVVRGVFALIVNTPPAPAIANPRPAARAGPSRPAVLRR
jgi:hypothetical protein